MKKYIESIIMSCLLSTVTTAQQTTNRAIPVLENHNTAFSVMSTRGRVYWISKLSNLGCKYTYNVTSGGHSWVNWRRFLLDFLPRLFK